MEPQVQFLPEDHYNVQETYGDPDNSVFNEYKARRAFVYHPNTNVVYVGAPGSHHDQVLTWMQQQGIPWVNNRTLGVAQEPMEHTLGFGMAPSPSGFIRTLFNTPHADNVVRALQPHFPTHEPMWQDAPIPDNIWDDEEPHESAFKRIWNK